MDPRPDEATAEAIQELQMDGFIRWSGRFHRGRPLFVATTEGRIAAGQSSELAEQRAVTPKAIATEGEDWDGDVAQLAVVVPSLLGDETLCDATFATKHEAFCAGVALTPGRRPLRPDSG